MGIVALVAGSAGVFLGLLFGGLYLGIRSLGLTVPTRYVSLQEVLDVEVQGAEAAPVEDIRDWAGLPLRGAEEAKRKLFWFPGARRPALVAGIFWPDPTGARRFWGDFYARTVSYVRKKSFRNSLWEPRFITGMYSGEPRYDITAWQGGQWFFYVGVPVEVEAHGQRKVLLREAVLDRIRRLAGGST
ncbi:hypothetical protein [Deferrisoma sp.]